MDMDQLFAGLVPEGDQNGQDQPEPILGPEFFDETAPDGQDGTGGAQETPPAGGQPHYQALYDRSQVELQAIKEQNELLKQQFALLARQQGGQPQQAAQGQPQQPESLEKPQRPQRPAVYDPIDATTNPNSASWKYREEMESFTERMAEYMDQLQERTLQQTRMEAERQAHQSRIAATNAQLASSYGMSQEEVADFWRVMNSPESMSLDNLQKLYRVIKGQPIAAQPPRARTPVPPVPAVRGASGAPQGSLENRIMDDLIRNSNRTSQF